MNICLVSQEYPPETGGGGIGTHTYYLAKNLVKMGHVVHVISKSVNEEREYMDGKVRVYRVKVSSPFWKVLISIGSFTRIGPSLRVLAYSWRINKKLGEIIEKYSIDVIEGAEYSAELFWFSLNKKVSFIIKLHTPSLLCAKLDKAHGSDRLMDLLEKITTIRADGIVSPSKSLKEIVAKEWNIEPSRIEILPNLINVEGLGKNSRENILDAKGNYILYFGKLERRKGVHVLADALPYVFKKFPDLKCVFVGKDLGLKRYIINKNKKWRRNLIFTGYVDKKQLLKIISNSTLIVLPSVWENFPYACLEAMALGKVVIASKTGGFREIIEDSVSGFLVQPEKPQDLAKKIVFCLRNKALLGEVGLNARRRIKETYSSDIIIKKVLRIYSKILSKNPCMK